MRLTDEQRQANKDAQRARDRAYRARCREYRSALEAAVAAAGQALREKAERAQTARTDALRQRAAIDAEFRQRIADLEHERSKALADFAPVVAGACEATDRAWDAVRAAEGAAEAEVAARFPDMQGHARWSAATWQPMSGARRKVTP